MRRKQLDRVLSEERGNYSLFFHCPYGIVTGCPAVSSHAVRSFERRGSLVRPLLPLVR